MMYWTDYMDEVRTDALEAIAKTGSDHSEWDTLYDDLFIDDSVTGNGSGSYTFSRAKAADNVAGIVWCGDFADRCREYGYDGVPTGEGPEAVDVIARCIALGDLSGELAEAWEALTADTRRDYSRRWALNDLGEWVDFGAAAALMADDLREEVHADMAPCSDQAFFEAYAVRHRARFGEDFAPWAGGAW